MAEELYPVAGWSRPSGLRYRAIKTSALAAEVLLLQLPQEPGCYAPAALDLNTLRVFQPLGRET